MVRLAVISLGFLLAAGMGLIAPVEARAEEQWTERAILQRLQ